MGANAILLVDDEPQVLKMIRMILEKSTIPVFAASSPGEAISVWKAHQSEIHMVVSDMDLKSEMSGYDLVKALRMDKPGLRSILISAYPPPSFTDQRAERIEFLQKPFDLRELIESIKGRSLLHAA